MPKKFLALVASAVAAGAVNGIIGTGGGIVLIFAAERIFRTDENPAKSAAVCAMFTVLCMSAGSAAVYAVNKTVGVSDVLPYLLPSVIGGALGGVLLKKISSRLLSLIFSLLVIFAGIRMLAG